MEASKRLLPFTDLSLGLERGTARLEDHNPRWKRAFSDEAHLIYDQLRSEGLRLYHCGSTSIPSIAAKPILDIVGSIDSLEELDSKKSTLESLGYEYKGEYGIEGRRYSVLYNPEKTHSFVHLHIFPRNHPALKDHYLFRDYLRANLSAAKGYEAEKKRLIREGISRENYSEGKSKSILSLLEKVRSAENSSPSVLALLGSAPGGNNTNSFLKEILNDKRADILNLEELFLDPYRYDSAYSFADQFPELVRRMIAADEVIFATPVYWYAMSGPMKNFFDRFSNLLRGPHKELGEALYGKKVSLLSTGSDECLPMGFEVPFASTAIYLGMDYMGAQYKSYP